MMPANPEKPLSSSKDAGADDTFGRSMTGIIQINDIQEKCTINISSDGLIIDSTNGLPVNHFPWEKIALVYLCPDDVKNTAAESDIVNTGSIPTENKASVPTANLALSLTDEQWMKVKITSNDNITHTLIPESASSLLSRMERHGSSHIKAETNRLWTAHSLTKERSPLNNVGILAILAFSFYLFWTSLTYIEHFIVDTFVPISAGKLLAKLYLPKFTASNSSPHPSVVKTVTSIGKNLINALHHDQRELFPSKISIIVVQQNTVNAFALPGGHIIVYTGLVNACETRDQLATILGHELSHVINRDGLKAVISQVKWQILMSLLAGDIGADQELILDQVKNLSSLKYSRATEHKADIFGLKLMHEAGFNIFEASKFFKILADSEEESSYPMTFMSDHPPTLERVETMKALASELGIRPNLESSESSNKPESAERLKNESNKLSVKSLEVDVTNWTKIRNLAKQGK